MAMTTLPTLYTAKSTANDVGDTGHWDGADANYLRTEALRIANHYPRTQSVAIDSAGTSTFAPTWKVYKPTNIAWTAKNATGQAMLEASCIVTVLTSTGITLVHGTGKDVTALITVFYA